MLDEGRQLRPRALPNVRGHEPDERHDVEEKIIAHHEKADDAGDVVEGHQERAKRRRRQKEPLPPRTMRLEGDGGGGC